MAKKFNGLNAIRKEQGLSAEKLGEKVGCSKQMIYVIERGESNPSFELAEKIAEALGCKIDDLR